MHRPWPCILFLNIQDETPEIKVPKSPTDTGYWRILNLQRTVPQYLCTGVAARLLKLILLNPAMAGRAVFRGQGKKIITENAYPAVLNAEEWETLQKRLTIRREGRHGGRTDSSPYLISGILRCGHCCGAMSGASAGPGRYAYYVCTNKKMARARCKEQIYHRREALEEAILGHFGQYSDPAMVRELLEVQGQESDAGDEAELTRINCLLT